MEKDECDSFIEEAEQIVQLFEEGYDVKALTENLSKRAPLIDPSTIPQDFDPVNICNLLKICSKPNSPSSTEMTESLRQRYQFRSEVEINVPPKSPESNQSPRFLRVIITISLIFLLCLIYYLQLPKPCPRPIW